MNDIWYFLVLVLFVIAFIIYMFRDIFGYEIIKKKIKKETKKHKEMSEESDAITMNSTYDDNISQIFNM